MQPTDDSALLRDYCENQSHEAFAELVTRHINLVYSVAVRHVGNPHHAEEITQAVFIILAKKAVSLRHDKALSSWLFQATHLTANNFIRSEMRRARREQEAYMQSTLNESNAGLWKEIAPLLDTAVARLGEKDRRAIVLRFYEGRNLREVGVALGANEEAAKKRISRALEKLRTAFAKRGVTSTAETIAGTISANSVQFAPATLAKMVTAGAIAKGATVSTSTLTLIKGALKIMAWTKAKTAIVTTVAVVLVTGTVTTTMVLHRHKPAPVTVPMASLKFAGYDTPESTMQSVLFAITQTNREMYMASLAPGGEFYRDMQTMPDKKWAQIRQQSEGGITGLTILDKQIISADTVALTVRAEGINQTGHFQLKRIGSEWKFDGAAKK